MRTNPRNFGIFLTMDLLDIFTFNKLAKYS